MRPNYSETIRAMEKGAALFIKSANSRSLQALCSQIGQKEGRKYVTEIQPSGLKIWRVV